MITDMSLERKYTFQFAPHVYDANDFLMRDQSQGKRLHEPTRMNSRIEPIAGNNNPNRAGRAHLDGGNLTACLESD